MGEGDSGRRIETLKEDLSARSSPTRSEACLEIPHEGHRNPPHVRDCSRRRWVQEGISDPALASEVL